MSAEIVICFLQVILRPLKSVERLVDFGVMFATKSGLRLDGASKNQGHEQSNDAKTDDKQFLHNVCK